ncbi:MAG: ribbon-helix-helix protein, CopG family [Deltaproteobacteria bacterium]|nr:ribbon-helix-helix protein, CopG family [Deltaproteobacteria bacterium]
MRSSKVIAISVSPQFESLIQRYARKEDRTISEFIREAVRHYVSEFEFESTRKAVARRMKKKGLKPSDVESVLAALRK